MASMWDKLKKLVSYNPDIEKKRKAKLAKKEMKGETVIGRRKGKVAKHSDVYMKAKTRKSKTLVGKDKDKPIEELKGHEVRTEFTPAQEVTKGGTYQKYGKDTKTAQSFRDAFAGARGLWKKGKGGDTFEWEGKKYSVKTADDKKRKEKFKKILPYMKGM